MTPVDVDPLPERPRVKRQSELPELIYAYHAMERGKAGSDEVSLLQNGLTLPGRRPVFTVERHREAQTARLRSMLDPIDRPLWMHMALVARQTLRHPHGRDGPRARNGREHPLHAPCGPQGCECGRPR